MKKTYTGGCHCGKVRFEVQADIAEVITCNCSRCRKVGALLSAVPMSDFKLLSGADELTDYQFNKRRIHHPFCRTCGIESYAYGKGPGGEDMVMLNVRCLDDVEPEQFKVRKFDGAKL
ncbi:MAG TPA: GFA family protein [Pseudolabrys sp.]|nr:GFA family protein [Pseudolabrys sp.]